MSCLISVLLGFPRFMMREMCYVPIQIHYSWIIYGTQVKLSNPSSKPLIYNVLTAGTDACDFHIAKGPTVTIPPKSTLPLSIQFTSRFLRPAEAILVLVGRRQGSAVGTTLTFNLRTQIDSIIPKVRFSLWQSHC